MTKPIEKKFPNNIMKYIKKIRKNKKQKEDNNFIAKVPTDFSGMGVSMSEDKLDKTKTIIEMAKKSNPFYMVSFINQHTNQSATTFFKCKNDEEAKIKCQQLIKNNSHDYLDGMVRIEILNRRTGVKYINEAVYQGLINEKCWQKII